MLVVTGFPGWLTDGFFSFLQSHSLRDWSAMRCIVHPDAKIDPSLCDQLPANTEIIRANLSDRAAVAEVLIGASHVLHAAGVLHVKRTKEWYTVNTDYTRQLVDLSVAAGVKRFVFISSNAAAGRSEKRGELLTEEVPAKPLSHYGRSKYLAEEYIRGVSQKIETVILRPCMFYGPPVPARHVDIYRRICTGKMPLVGDGGFDRSVIHIQNLAEMCYLSLTSAAAVGQTYYVADEKVYSTKQIVEAMGQALEVKPRFLRLPAFVAQCAYRLDMALAAMGIYWQTLHLVGEADWNVGLSCEKAKRELGYTSKFSLTEGMKEAVDWCRLQRLLP